MLQSKKQSRYGAVKLLDFATTRFSAPCDKLVDLGGLKHLFGIFMGKARIKGPKGEGEGGRQMNVLKGLLKARWPSNLDRLYAPLVSVHIILYRRGECCQLPLYCPSHSLLLQRG